MNPEQYRRKNFRPGRCASRWPEGGLQLTVETVSPRLTPGDKQWFSDVGCQETLKSTKDSRFEQPVAVCGYSLCSSELRIGSTAVNKLTCHCRCCNVLHAYRFRPSHEPLDKRYNLESTFRRRNRSTLSRCTLIHSCIRQAERAKQGHRKSVYLSTLTL